MGRRGVRAGAFAPGMRRRSTGAAGAAPRLLSVMAIHALLLPGARESSRALGASTAWSPITDCSREALDGAMTGVAGRGCGHGSAGDLWSDTAPALRQFYPLHSMMGPLGRGRLDNRHAAWALEEEEAPACAVVATQTPCAHALAQRMRFRVTCIPARMHARVNIIASSSACTERTLAWLKRMHAYTHIFSKLGF